MTMTMVQAQALTLSHVHCRYGKDDVVRDISLTLSAGHIGCLLGPSGCGKTTLLRAIAGLEPIAQGEIHIGDSLLSRAGFRMPPQQRGIGMVFQDWALFPHLTVRENIHFGLLDWRRTDARLRVEHLLAVTELGAHADKLPQALSGGQQQRVALVRALAPKPKLLLLDEPFSSLDASLRTSLAQEVRQLIKQEGMTAILVTHDHHEAYAMADDVGVMMHGQLQQWAKPYQVYHEPVSRPVAEFVGEGVFLVGQKMSHHQVHTEFGNLNSRHIIPGEIGGFVNVMLRPDDVIHDDNARTTAQVVDKVFRGADFLYTLETSSGLQIQALVPSHHNHAIHERIGFKIAADHVITFPR